MNDPGNKILTREIQRILLRDGLQTHGLHQHIDQLAAVMGGPKVTAIAPFIGPPGTMITITGIRFSPKRWENEVTVEGEPAFVAEASKTELKAIVGLKSKSGDVKVTVDGKTATAPIKFEVTKFPGVGISGDGPPVFYAGTGSGAGAQAGVDPNGTVKALVVICQATDKTPGNPSAVSTALQTEFNEAIDYYDEVSYGRTNLQLDYTNWVSLGGEYDDYVDASIDNIDNPAGLNRIVAEAAQGAVDQGLDLDDYVAMAVVLYLDGGFIRAWGGWSSSNFSYSDATTSINLTTSQPLGLMAIGDNADWGRFAHEVAHNFVDAGAVLGEDIYSSDLIDSSVATASSFDLMGNHDTHPCFSAHFMSQLGYYDPSNVIDLDWDRNPFSQGFTLQAHGTTENNASGRAHAVRISIGSGLEYYVEVREKNSSSSLHFDTEIPIAAGSDGGVIVTKVFTDEVNINQEMRFITLMHDARTQGTGTVIEDPIRGLTITVGNVIASSPLVMDIDIAWAQTIGDNPEGTFDLEMSQTGVSWVSDDIWVDRQPFGLDPEEVGGNVVATIERPRPGEINHLFGQVRCNGADSVSNVKMTYYAISPPGVGDNGAWAPIATETIPSIAANGEESASINWTPTVDQHTCLKVHASPQFGEVSGSNNTVQENVFHFTAPASSPPDAVSIEFAVRNPLEESAIIPVEVTGVPEGYVVHLPHRWFKLPALGERKTTLTVVPIHDITAYRSLQHKDRRKLEPTAWIHLLGRVPRQYFEDIDVTKIPGYSHLSIGGITASVTPKYRAEIELNKEQDRDRFILYGRVIPAAADQRVTIAIRDEKSIVKTIDVLTDPAGSFNLQIPLQALNIMSKPWDGSKYTGGKFEVWAETTYADALAPARSKPCYFEFKAGRIDGSTKLNRELVKTLDTTVRLSDNRRDVSKLASENNGDQTIVEKAE